MADFYTDPTLASLAASFLATSAGNLSSFQKDLYNTYLTLVEDPVLLKRLLSDPDCLTERERTDVIALGKVVSSSPSFLTLLAAAAEPQRIPALASQLNTGIQEFITGLNSPMAVPRPTGVPILDAVIAKLYTISQTTAYTNVSNSLFRVTRRNDFLAFTQGLAPVDLVPFIPFATKLALQLPIDAPDSEVPQSVVALIFVGFLLAVAGGVIATTGGFLLFAIGVLVGAIGVLLAMETALNVALEIAELFGIGHGEGPPGQGSPGV